MLHSCIQMQALACSLAACLPAALHGSGCRAARQPILPPAPCCPPPPACFLQCNLFFVFSQFRMLRQHPRFESLLRMVPCDLWKALRGRTLWLVGDSQAQVWWACASGRVTCCCCCCCCCCTFLPHEAAACASGGKMPLIAKQAAMAAAGIWAPVAPHHPTLLMCRAALPPCTTALPPPDGLLPEALCASGEVSARARLAARGTALLL